jgi:high affinity sulfate transporter 1
VTTAKSTSSSRFPLFEGILPLQRERLPTDVIAGITLAALGIPEVMGYAKIAGTPVITGLYTILIPIAVFAILGSSRHLVVGADSASAAILAAGLVGLAPLGSPQYVALAGACAIVTGAILLIARLIRLGFLADFLSRTVLIGFLTGVGIQVAMGQLPGMLGVAGGTGRTLQKFWQTLKEIPQTSVATLAVALGVLAVILGAKMISKKIPGALIAVIGAIALSYAFDWSAHGIAVLGTVPSGLPKFGIPDVTWSQVTKLLGTSFSIFLVILAQSAATSRAYASKYSESFSENVDLVGLSLSNVAAGLSGTFVVNGSPTKTQMVDSAGGRSQVSQITTSFIVLIVLLFLTPPLAYMPDAVLAAVVFLIGVELVDIPNMRRVMHQRMDEFIVAAITATVVVVFGVEQGILLAIVLSLLDHVRRGYNPHNSVIARDERGRIRSMPLESGGELAPGLVVYRFAASLYYANSTRFSEQVLGIVENADPAVSWFCLDAAAVSDVDFSAAQTLRETHESLKEKGVRLVFAEMQHDVREGLRRYGILELLGEDSFFPSVQEVAEAYGETSLPRGPQGSDPAPS